MSVGAVPRVLLDLGGPCTALTKQPGTPPPSQKGGGAEGGLVRHSPSPCIQLATATQQPFNSQQGAAGTEQVGSGCGEQQAGPGRAKRRGAPRINSLAESQTWQEGVHDDLTDWAQEASEGDHTQSDESDGEGGRRQATDCMPGCFQCQFTQDGCPACNGKPFVTRPHARARPYEGRPQQVPEAPTYYPTEQEFHDPFAYIQSIREHASRFGICRIVPPPGWEPPFAFDTGADGSTTSSFRFQTRRQYTSHLCMRAPQSFATDAQQGHNSSATGHASPRQTGQNGGRMGGRMDQHEAAPSTPQAKASSTAADSMQQPKTEAGQPLPHHDGTASHALPQHHSAQQPTGTSGMQGAPQQVSQLVSDMPAVKVESHDACSCAAHQPGSHSSAATACTAYSAGLVGTPASPSGTCTGGCRAMWPVPLVAPPAQENGILPAVAYEQGNAAAHGAATIQQQHGTRRLSVPQVSVMETRSSVPACHGDGSPQGTTGPPAAESKTATEVQQGLPDLPGCDHASFPHGQQPAEAMGAAGQQEPGGTGLLSQGHDTCTQQAEAGAKERPHPGVSRAKGKRGVREPSATPRAQEEGVADTMSQKSEGSDVASLHSDVWQRQAEDLCGWHKDEAEQGAVVAVQGSDQSEGTLETRPVQAALCEQQVTAAEEAAPAAEQQACAPEDNAFGHGYCEREHTLHSFAAYAKWAHKVHFGLLPRQGQLPQPIGKGTKGFKGKGGASRHSSQQQCRRRQAPSVEQVEAEFWRLVETPAAGRVVETLYGSDIDTCRHGSGFPLPTWRAAPTDTHADTCHTPLDMDAHAKLYRGHPWNINNMPRSSSSVLRYVKCDDLITGVMVPWLYVGSCLSAFCWHIEDHSFYSINYLHVGAPKVWYGVPAHAALAFEVAMRDALPHLFAEDPLLLHRLVTMLSPAELMARGVPVHRLVHEAGSFVVTFPGAYHAGFNMGFNVAEAVNFAPPDWLPYGSDVVRKYKAQGKAPTLSHDMMLLTLVSAAPLAAARTGLAARQATPGLDTGATGAAASGSLPQQVEGFAESPLACPPTGRVKRRAAVAAAAVIAAVNSDESGPRGSGARGLAPAPPSPVQPAAAATPTAAALPTTPAPVPLPSPGPFLQAPQPVLDLRATGGPAICHPGLRKQLIPLPTTPSWMMRWDDGVTLADAPLQAVLLAIGEFTVRLEEAKQQIAAARAMGLTQERRMVSRDEMHKDATGLHTSTADCDCLQCKCDLYLWAVVSAERPGACTCVEHIAALGVPPEQCILLYRYSLDELDDMLHNALALLPEAQPHIDAARARVAAPMVAFVHRLGPIVVLEGLDSKYQPNEDLFAGITVLDPFAGHLDATAYIAASQPALLPNATEPKVQPPSCTSSQHETAAPTGVGKGKGSLRGKGTALGNGSLDMSAMHAAPLPAPQTDFSGVLKVEELLGLSQLADGSLPDLHAVLGAASFVGTLPQDVVAPPPTAAAAGAEGDAQQNQAAGTARMGLGKRKRIPTIKVREDAHLDDLDFEEALNGAAFNSPTKHSNKQAATAALSSAAPPAPAAATPTAKATADAGAAADGAPPAVSNAAGGLVPVAPMVPVAAPQLPSLDGIAGAAQLPVPGAGLHVEETAAGGRPQRKRKPPSHMMAEEFVTDVPHWSVPAAASAPVAATASNGAAPMAAAAAVQNPAGPGTAISSDHAATLAADAGVILAPPPPPLEPAPAKPSKRRAADAGSSHSKDASAGPPGFVPVPGAQPVMPPEWLAGNSQGPIHGPILINPTPVVKGPATSKLQGQQASGSGAVTAPVLPPLQSVASASLPSHGSNPSLVALQPAPSVAAGQTAPNTSSAPLAMGGAGSRPSSELPSRSETPVPAPLPGMLPPPPAPHHIQIPTIAPIPVPSLFPPVQIPDLDLTVASNMPPLLPPVQLPDLELEAATTDAAVTDATDTSNHHPATVPASNAATLQQQQQHVQAAQPSLFPPLIPMDASMASTAPAVPSMFPQLAPTGPTSSRPNSPMPADSMPPAAPMPASGMIPIDGPSLFPAVNNMPAPPVGNSRPTSPLPIDSMMIPVDARANGLLPGMGAATGMVPIVPLPSGSNSANHGDPLVVLPSFSPQLHDASAVHQGAAAPKLLDGMAGNTHSPSLPWGIPLPDHNALALAQPLLDDVLDLDGPLDEDFTAVETDVMEFFA